MTPQIWKRLPIARTYVTVALASAIALIGCGPPLTDPGSTDVTGTWFSAGPAAGLTDVTIVLSQTAAGVISGTYDATGTQGLQFCPSTPPCTISGTISGGNTVFQIFFELKDAGQFSGQLTDGGDLNGAMSRISSTQPIRFVKR